MKISVFGIILFSVLLFSCTKNEKSVTGESYEVVTPEIIDTSVYLDFVVEVEAIKHIEIRTKANGFLEKVFVDEGGFVREGQLLFTINKREAEELAAKASANLIMAKAEAKNTELELENTRSLAEKNIVSKIELEFAKNKVQIAKAKVAESVAEEAQAKLKLSYAEIRAPFAGFIGKLPIKMGSLITEGTLLTTLSKSDEVYAYFDVSERQYLNFASDWAKETKKPVQLILANDSIHPYTGSIQTMDSQIDEETGNLSVRAKFDNPKNVLKHGASGKIRMGKDLPKAMVIPQVSTFEIQDRTFVYMLDKNNRARTQAVEIDQRLPHFYTIRGGLKTSDKIIYEGIQGVSEGMLIAPKEVSLKAILNKKLNQQ